MGKTAIIHGMTIRVYLTEHEEPDILCRSPRFEKSSGIRMKLGWSMIRIGARIMFGRNWVKKIE